MAMRPWPEVDDIHPVSFLIWGVIWWVLGLVLTLVIVGQTLYSDTTPDGRYVKIYNCTQAESDAGKSCTYQTAGTYFHETVRSDAQMDGFIVGAIVVISYSHHLLRRLWRRREVDAE
jgi:hypothetical protein